MTTIFDLSPTEAREIEAAFAEAAKAMDAAVLTLTEAYGLVPLALDHEATIHLTAAKAVVRQAEIDLEYWANVAEDIADAAVIHGIK